MSKFDAQQLFVALAKSIRKKIYPSLNLEPVRQVEGIAHSGDVTFQLDVIAEQELKVF
jgi:hypothetical protein